jgi:hypothetical protein
MSATPVQNEQAQSRFVRGKELFEAGDYEAALREFEASRAIVASPNSRLYVARCLRELDRLIDAYSAYGRTMIDALELAKLESRYARTADAARTEREELESRLAFLKFSILNPQPKTQLLVNGEEIRRAAWSEPVVVMPGDVAVELLTPGQDSQHRQLSLVAGGSEEITLSVEKAPEVVAPQVAEPVSTPVEPKQPAPSRHSLRPYAYASMAVSAVGFGAFGAFGYMSKKNYDDLEQACSTGTCPQEEQDRIDTGRQQQLYANIGLGVGVAGAAAAITLWLLDSDEEPSTAIYVSPTGIGIRGKL